MMGVQLQRALAATHELPPTGSKRPCCVCWSISSRRQRKIPSTLCDRSFPALGVPRGSMRVGGSSRTLDAAPPRGTLRSASPSARLRSLQHRWWGAVMDLAQGFMIALRGPQGPMVNPPQRGLFNVKRRETYAAMSEGTMSAEAQTLVDGVRAELTAVYAALESIQNRLLQLAEPPDGPIAPTGSGAQFAMAEPPGGVTAPTGWPAARAVAAAPPPPPPDGAKAPTGRGFVRLAAAEPPPPDGAKAPTGRRVRAEPPDGVTAPTGRLTTARPEDPTGGPWELVLPSGAPVQVSNGTRWVWVNGVLVVF